MLRIKSYLCIPTSLQMAKYCDEIFGELLLKEPLKDVHLLPGVPLPSPNQLKGKLLTHAPNQRPHRDIDVQS